MIFKCYSSEKLITLNILHEAALPGTHFTAESTEAMQIKYLAQGNNILLPGFEPSTSVSKTDILANRPIYNIIYNITWMILACGCIYIQVHMCVCKEYVNVCMCTCVSICVDMFMCVKL